MMFYLGVVTGFSAAFMVFAILSSNDQPVAEQRIKIPRY